MRFMMIVKASKDSEAGKLPDETMIAKMGRYNEQLVNAGVLVDAAGLQASSKGARIKYARDGKVSVIDGPFAETKELIAGFLGNQCEVVAGSNRLGKESPQSTRGRSRNRDRNPAVL